MTPEAVPNSSSRQQPLSNETADVQPANLGAAKDLPPAAPHSPDQRKHWGHGQRRLSRLASRATALEGWLEQHNSSLVLKLVGVAHEKHVVLTDSPVAQTDLAAFELPASVVKLAARPGAHVASLERNQFWRDVLAHYAANPPRLGIAGVNALWPLRAARARFRACLGESYYEGQSLVLKEDGENFLMMNTHGPVPNAPSLPGEIIWGILEMTGLKAEYLRFGVAPIPPGSEVLPENLREKGLTIYRIPDESLLQTLHGIGRAYGVEFDGLNVPAEYREDLAADFIQGCLILYNDVNQLTNLFGFISRGLADEDTAAREYTALFMAGAGHEGMLINLLNSAISSRRITQSQLHDQREPQECVRRFSRFFVQQRKEILDAIAIFNDELCVDSPRLIELFGKMLCDFPEDLERYWLVSALGDLFFPREHTQKLKDEDGGISLTRSRQPRYQELAQSLAAAAGEEKLLNRFQLIFIAYWFQLEKSLLWNTPVAALRVAAREKTKAARAGKIITAWDAILRVSSDDSINQILCSLTHLGNRPVLKRLLADRELCSDGLPSPLDCEEYASPEAWRIFMRERERLTVTF